MRSPRAVATGRGRDTAHWRWTMPVHLTCSRCGVPISRAPSRVRPKNWCSNRCQSMKQRLPVTVEDGVARVPVFGRDGELVAHALVDACDAEFIARWRWILTTHGYAYRSLRIDGKQRTFRMHREVLGLTQADTVEVDHRNHDRLDNRRGNLRLVPTRSAQMQNASAHRGSSSSHRGVSWRSDKQKWVAQVMVNGKQYYLGLYATEEEAAEAARLGRRRLMPYALD